jgi:hypothetical protein
MADEPTFWGVWVPGQESPELLGSREEAIERAYQIAMSRVGLTVHLMEMKTNGTVKFPMTPTVSGALAGYPHWELKPRV